VALNADMRTGDFSSLASLYAGGATLTTYRSLPRDLYREQTGEARGLSAITRVYGEIHRAFLGYRWIQVQVDAISDGRIVSHERIQGPPGSHTLWSETIATIRGAKIRHLDWTLDWGLRR
jgi:hypothetical protein